MHNQFSLISDLELIPEHVQLKKRERFCYIKNEEVYKDRGLATIVTLPNKQICYSPEYLEGEQKMVILVHGHLSHKNAIYQPLLAEMLSDLGYLVVRFDFRCQGDSEDNFDMSIGRTINQDIEDLETIIKYFTSCYTITDEGIFSDAKPSLDMVIAHSRGVLPMLSYFSNLGNNVTAPTLVNCCGRYLSEGLLKRYTKLYPNWEEKNGFWTKTFRYGKYADYWVSKEEIISAGSFSTDLFENIPKTTQIINIYGTCDGVIPMKDAELYYDLFRGRSSIFLIPGADHNFYGLSDDSNAFRLPVKRGKVNYSYYLVALLNIALRNKSFKSIDGSNINATIPGMITLLQ